MKRGDDQELWDLLGRGPEPTISPFFARNVVREIRQGRDWKTGWFGPRRLIPVLGSVGLLIAIGLVRWQTAVGPLAEPALDTLATVDTLDSEVIMDVEDLVASDENNSLDESILL